MRQAVLGMSLVENLQEMERTREAYWLRYPTTGPLKLRWRALTVRHTLHLLPGQSILELGAGSGLWTSHLSEVTRGENPITAAVFNADLSQQAMARELATTSIALVDDLKSLGNGDGYDFVVGTAILCHDRCEENLEALTALLKPGGQLLFFEANYWNPQVFVKSAVPSVGRWTGNAECQTALRRYRLLKRASAQGLVSLEIVPYDIVHARTPARLLGATQSLSYLIEHLPGVREMCGTLLIWGRKPTMAPVAPPRVDLTRSGPLTNKVSVVVPCHNEAMNIGRLVTTLTDLYDSYIYEFVVVDDNSTDGTADVAEALAVADPRIRVVRRTAPPGVGRALRDGYQAARGEYILTLDCDFFLLGPELRDLFDAVAAGHDGAIGSRFSRESILLNYPGLKILGNRGFHLLVKWLLDLDVRDVSNNLKLMRADILRQLEIVEDGFAANAETGLKPLVAGYDIVEVPMSWIGRSTDMGSSSFRTLEVAPGYARVLSRTLRAGAAQRRAGRRDVAATAPPPARPPAPAPKPPVPASTNGVSARVPTNGGRPRGAGASRAVRVPVGLRVVRLLLAQSRAEWR